jgi:O-antigen/teichoic acid export membrane protein
VSGEAAGEARRYGAAAGMLTVALGTAGLLTYGFFALASHSLNADDYGQIVVLWSLVFILVSTLFRPVEQLLARTVAELEAHGESTGHALRVAAAIQLGVAVLFVVAALALRGALEKDLLEGNELLFWAMLAAVLAFGASFFTRGFLAGRRQFGLYSALLIIDGGARLAFAMTVAVGIASGMNVVAIGIAVAPALSLVVVPVALRRRHHRPAPIAGADDAGDAAVPAVAGEPEAASVSAEAVPEFTLAHGGGFAGAVLLIMLSEQVFLNGGPLFARAELGAAAAGFIFNVLMVARAPVVLFQAVAASLLPHLTRLRSRGGETSEEAFRLSVRLTIAVVAGVAAVTLAVVLAAGPQLMQIAFGDKFEYDRTGLGIVAVGMGFYLAAATLNQAALAQGQVRRAALCWLGCAGAFIVWNLTGALEVFRRVEIGFTAGAAVLCLLLYLIYRTPHPRAGDELAPGSPRELEARLAAADEVG